MEDESEFYGDRVFPVSKTIRYAELQALVDQKFGKQDVSIRYIS